MQQKNSYTKTVTTTLKIEDIDGKVDVFDPSANSDERLKFIKSILELPENFQDDIDVVIKNEKVIFRWHPNKIDNRAELLHKNALILARKGNLDDAIKRWNQAAKINPMDPDYFFNLGVAFYEQKKFQEAIEHLSKVLAICPLYTKVHLIIGIAFLKLRKFDFAKKHIMKSLKFEANKYLSYLNLGAIYSILKEYEDGLKMFERAIQIAQHEPRPYLGLAKIYTTIGNTEKANFYFKKVIELDKKGVLANYAKRYIISVHSDIMDEVDHQTKGGTSNPEEYYSEGFHYYISGDYEKASMMYQKYLMLKPEDDYVWYALGESHLRSGKLGNAFESFSKAIKLYPKKELYFKELAIVLDKLGKPDKVIAATTKAKELGKSDSVTLCLWGKALYDLGNFDEAIRILEESLSGNKNNFLAKYYLALAYEKINKINEALDYLIELKEVKINTPIREKAKSLYEKLAR